MKTEKKYCNMKIEYLVRNYSNETNKKKKQEYINELTERNIDTSLIYNCKLFESKQHLFLHQITDEIISNCIHIQDNSIDLDNDEYLNSLIELGKSALAYSNLKQQMKNEN